MVGASGTGGVEVVLTLLTEVVILHMRLLIIEIRESSLQLPFSVTFLMASRFRTIGLCLEKRIHTELCHCLKVFLVVFGGRCGWDWTTCIARCGSPLFGGVPKCIGIAVWLTVGFCKSEMPCHGADFGSLTELLQTDWLTRWVWRI